MDKKSIQDKITKILDYIFENKEYLSNTLIPFLQNIKLRDKVGIDSDDIKLLVSKLQLYYPNVIVKDLTDSSLIIFVDDNESNTLFSILYIRNPDYYKFDKIRINFAGIKYIKDMIPVGASNLINFENDEEREFIKSYSRSITIRDLLVAEVKDLAYQIGESSFEKLLEYTLSKNLVK